MSNKWTKENADKLVLQRESGMTFRAIGEHWGVSPNQAQVVYARELRRRVWPGGWYDDVTGKRKKKQARKAK